ncbi:hypothetical protein Taro_006446 [Colocasia esculenta]|uniref:Uncharacterized protein n=1 Tax=Colocasia esculenta TaxID=4460 RepID=A0A843TXC9_COLES|nr:hypothetical protein [Colocasia esculenta]
MLNDDTNSTGFYFVNERDVRHHVTEEHVIEEDEEDEIDSHDDIDDNERMDEEDDEPLFDIARKFLNAGSTIGAWVVGQLTPAL